MKIRFFITLLLSIFVMIETKAQVRMCPVCKKSVKICPYKGNHPKKVQKTDKKQRWKNSIKTINVNGVIFKMVKVQGGTFRMGEDLLEDNKEPVHNVTLFTYYIGQTEVTQALWETVMGYNPSYIKRKDFPVYKISWYECQAFVERLSFLTGESFRLPTEAEWEFAARGGNKSKKYQYSGSNNIDEVAWYWRNSGEKYLTGEWDFILCMENNCIQHSVATKRPNELGIYDMTGNVEEWCQDWFGGYEPTDQINPEGPETGNYRICRGGSYKGSESNSRIVARWLEKPSDDYFSVGLRLAMDD